MKKGVNEDQPDQNQLDEAVIEDKLVRDLILVLVPALVLVLNLVLVLVLNLTLLLVLLLVLVMLPFYVLSSLCRK